MIKVKVTNEVDGRRFGATFDNGEEAAYWRNDCIAKNSWGLPQREVRDITGLEDRILSQRDVVIDITDELAEVYVLYTVKADYVIETITEENNPEFRREMRRQRRQKAMPRIEEVLESLIESAEGDNTKLDQILARRAKARTDHPVD